MLGQKVATRIAIVNAGVLRKLPHTFFEIVRGGANLNEMRDAGRSVKGYPIEEFSFIPERTMGPNGFKVTAQRRLGMRVVRDGNRLSDIRAFANLHGAQSSKQDIEGLFARQV